MHKILPICFIAAFFSFTGYSQDFSNKGKDFYLCFPNHVPSAAAAKLSVWITSDKASSGTITMANGAFTSNFNILANGLAEINIPSSAAFITNGESSNGTTIQILKKSIRVKVDVGKPAVVAYVQQYGAARSAASLLLPTNVLGKKYYAVSFTQTGADNGSFIARSQFQIIATKDNTVVTITPRKNGVLGTPFTVTFPLAGDMIQYQSSDGAAATQDLTGTYIESIASGSSGCLPIAVFSGSSNLRIATQTPCSNAGNSFDPLLQQLYPISTWGKNFGFVPFANYPNGVPYRVMASEDNTQVYFNGALVATLNAGQIYPTAFTANPPTISVPTSISADKPICVTEYMQSSGCSGQGTIQGDPDMVVLNPIEQNISDITIFSTKQEVIKTQWINILIKDAGISSFKISRNGGPLAAPTGTWQPFTPLPGYSYLQQQLVAPGTGPNPISDSYRFVSDSGFNAIAYGLGDNESYAYSAGTNVKDLYQQISVQSQYGIESSPSVCTNSPFRFKVSLPYCADSIEWDLSSLPGPPTPTNPTIKYSSCAPGAGGPDSTTLVNGKVIYWYSLPTIYTFANAGLFPVLITAYNKGASLCGSSQDIDFELGVFDPPNAGFTNNQPGCLSVPVQFNDTTITIKPNYRWDWNFGDPGSGAANTSALKNPVHIFSTSGPHTVTLITTTTVGCFSSQASKVIDVPPIPTATISGAITLCINTGSANNITFTGSGGVSPYVFSYHINNGPIQTITSSGAAALLPINTTVAGTFTYYLDSIKNQGSAICNQPQVGNVVVNITPDATVTLTSNPSTANQTVCINNLITDITYAVGGSGTGGSVTGLPAGVTGTYLNGIITITGTPSVSGVFNYTVSTTGPCVNPTITGTINVTIDATLALSSQAATSNQTVCINNAITNITYTVGGSGTGGSVTGLPTGVTGTYSGGVITITGTPTVSGTFNYMVLTTGPCVKPTLTGTINVTPDATITLSSPAPTANQTVCINNAITNITYAVGASGTGGSVSGLPAGVTGTYASGVITISGSPSVTGLFNYTVSITGPCINPTATGTITVKPDATITLTSGSATINQMLCNNQPITPITYQIGGGGTGATVSGLPAGVTGTYGGSVFTISGTPTVSGSFNYTVSTTGTCLQKTATGSILVNPKPTASFTTTGPYCSGLAVNFTPAFGITPTGSVVSWVWDFGDGAGPQTFTNGNPFTVTYPNAGVKTVTFKTISDLGCVSDLFTMAITVNSKPKAAFINPAACLADANAQFYDTSKVAGAGASIVFWSWDFGDGSPIFAGSGPAYKDPVHAYTAVGQKTVTLIVTTNSGCKDTVVQQFFINGEVTRAAFITQNPANLCSNRPVQIKENSLVNVGFLIRTDIYWDYTGAPTVFDQDNTPTPGKIYTHSYPNLQTTKTYRVRYYAYSGFNGVCQKDTIIDITVNASPVAQFITVPDVCLNGGIVTLTQGSASGGTGVYMGPGVSFSGGVYTFDPLASGVVLGSNNGVIYTVTSPAGCDSALVQKIRVLAPPMVNSFSPVGNICHNNAITFQNTYTNGDGTVTKWIYNWNDGSPLQTMTTGANVSHVYTTPGTHTATLTLETGYGCKNVPFPATFTVNPLPIPTYTFSNSACLPSANIVFTNTTPNTSENTYFWSFELPSTSPANTSTITTGPSHTYTAQGPFNTNLVATNIITGCIGTSPTVIIDGNTIHPEPIVKFSAIPDVCLNNGTVQITQGSETSGMAGGPGVYSGPGVSPSGVFDPIAAGVGSHTLTYTWTSSFNCPSSKTQNINVLAPPVVNTFTIKGNKCETQDVVFQNTVTQGAGTINTWIYDWGDGTPNTIATNGNDITHIYALPGTYTASLYVITNNSCKSAPPLQLTVTVNPLPIPDFTYSDTGCLPQAKVIFKNMTPNINDWAYNWNFDFPSANPADQSTQQQNVPYIYTTLAPHDVKLTATSGLTGCSASKIKPVTTIHPAPVASFNFNKPGVCLGQKVTVLDNSTFADGTSSSWTWNFGENATIATGRVQPPYTFTTADTFNVKLSIKNSFGCTDDTIRGFRVYANPTADAGPDQFVLQGGTTILKGAATGKGLTFLWTASSPVSYLTNPTVLQPTSIPFEEITYTLKVTASGGCSATDMVFIKVLKEPTIPNTFTPNGDGMHDFWDIKYLSQYLQNRVQVFTKSGNLVFESRGYTKPWDGTINGKLLPLDTYYYIIEPGNGRKPFTGYVTIVR